MTPQRFSTLLEKWRNGSISVAETEEFIQFANSSHHEDIISDFIETDLKAESFKNLSTEKEKTKTLQVLRKQYPRKGVLVNFRGNWLKYAAAILIIAAAGMYFWKNNVADNAVEKIASTKSTDVAAPETMRAIITLSDGRVIRLDTIANGELAIQGNVKIKKLSDGKIIYEGLSEGEVIYNTITVPRGSKTTSLTLSDGTKVYLNSASSLRYPVSFSSKERKVEITGEGYFEIAKDAKRKFIVSAGNTNTEVLGTAFNINAYPDESIAAITLLEGAVKVSAGNNYFILKPGEQSRINKENVLNLAEDVNIDEVIAWKNGYFQFKEADLKTIARQISRWYDVDFVFENKKAESEIFRGEFSRTSSLSELLKVLEYSDVKFTIDGNKVIIK
jgi:transmembrane sensor